MQRTNYDVLVLGLGVTGGAALYHLAKSGLRVLGIDRFAPPHHFGSSHGHTRIYRQAYYEAPEYVPLATRALELWRALERDTGRTLFTCTGALTIAPENNLLLAGALRSAQQHDIAHEVMSLPETISRFPAFRAPTGSIGLYEATAGVLFAGLCVSSHLEMAAKAGAEIHLHEPATSIVQQSNGSVVVQTERTDEAGHVERMTYEAGQVVVATGAWAPRLLNLEHAFRVTRETVHWFDTISPVASAAGGCPVSLIAMEDSRMFYSIPDFGDGFKAGLHHSGLKGDAHLPPAAVDARDAETVAAAVGVCAPAAAGRLRASVPCFYTSTPDQHFAIGALPSASHIILAAACSGHGFKFAPAIGESIAQMVRGEKTALPMDVFNVARLGLPKTGAHQLS